jgi:hypothetical protein
MMASGLDEPKVSPQLAEGGYMANREMVKDDVVAVLDMLSSLDLASMDRVAVEAVPINFTSGFDSSLKKALCVPFTKIARKHAAGKFRVISQTETVALKTVKGAIDLSTAAADNLSFDGE